jgi:hypothetical protein
MDAIRSLKRYVAIALGDDVEVRMSGEKGVFHRPFAKVTQVPSVQMTVESWHTAKIIAAYQVTVFPVRKDSADESQQEVQRLAERLWVAFGGPGVGTPTLSRVADPTRGFPMRIPLYDYEAIAVRGPAAFATEADRDPRDFMKLEAPPALQLTQNDDDELLWSIAANIRMSWLRSAAVPSTASTTVSVPVEAVEEYG